MLSRGSLPSRTQASTWRCGWRIASKSCGDGPGSSITAGQRCPPHEQSHIKTPRGRECRPRASRRASPRRTHRACGTTVRPWLRPDTSSLAWSAGTRGHRKELRIAWAGASSRLGVTAQLGTQEHRKAQQLLSYANDHGAVPPGVPETPTKSHESPYSNGQGVDHAQRGCPGQPCATCAAAGSRSG